MPARPLVLALLLTACHAAPSAPLPIAPVPAAPDLDSPLAHDLGDAPEITPAEPAIDDAAELGPALGIAPIAPLLLLDTRTGEGVCGPTDPLGRERMHGPLKLELADCARVPLPADARAVAITLTLTPRDANGASVVAIGARKLYVAAGTTTVHHLVAPTLGTALVLQGDRTTIDVTAELTAILSPDAEHLSVVRMLDAPVRIADRALAPEDHLDVSALATELALSPSDVTGVLAIARIAPTAPCTSAPFEVAIGPKPETDAGSLATLARCERADPWSRGILVATRGAELALRTEGTAPEVAIDVIALLTSDRTAPGALVHLAPRGLALTAHVDAERPTAVTAPVPGAIAALAHVSAWPADRGTLTAGGAELALSGEEHTWAALAIDEGAIALVSTTPAVVDVTLDAVLAPE